MKLTLVEEKIRETIHKNTATSYGLTLVIGLPFPAEMSRKMQDFQQQLESLAPGCFTWYDLDHLHATLVAPLRGRYRNSPPLQRAELPTDLPGFAQDLANFFAQYPPFFCELAGVRITAEGLVIVEEKTLTQQLASCLQRYPILDQPKHWRGLQVAIGFCHTNFLLVMKQERTHLEDALSQMADASAGRMIVRQVWLVHYANRTLNRVIGKIPFILGQSSSLNAECLLRELGIVVT